MDDYSFEHQVNSGSHWQSQLRPTAGTTRKANVAGGRNLGPQPRNAQPPAPHQPHAGSGATYRSGSAGNESLQSIGSIDSLSGQPRKRPSSQDGGGKRERLVTFAASPPEARPRRGPDGTPQPSSLPPAPHPQQTQQPVVHMDPQEVAAAAGAGGAAQSEEGASPGLYVSEEDHSFSLYPTSLHHHHRPGSRTGGGGGGGGGGGLPPRAPSTALRDPKPTTTTVTTGQGTPPEGINDSGVFAGHHNPSSTAKQKTTTRSRSPKPASQPAATKTNPTAASTSLRKPSPKRTIATGGAKAAPKPSGKKSTPAPKQQQQMVEETRLAAESESAGVPVAKVSMVDTATSKTVGGAKKVLLEAHDCGRDHCNHNRHSIIDGVLLKSKLEACEKEMYKALDLVNQLRLEAKQAEESRRELENQFEDLINQTEATDADYTTVIESLNLEVQSVTAERDAYREECEESSTQVFELEQELESKEAIVANQSLEIEQLNLVVQQLQSELDEYDEIGPSGAAQPSSATLRGNTSSSGNVDLSLTSFLSANSSSSPKRSQLAQQYSERVEDIALLERRLKTAEREKKEFLSTITEQQRQLESQKQVASTMAVMPQKYALLTAGTNGGVGSPLRSIRDIRSE